MPMAKRWMKGVLAPRDMKELSLALQTPIEEDTSDLFGTDKVDEADKAEPSTADKNKALTMLHRIHRNAAHCGNKTLARALRDDGAPQWIVKLAEQFVPALSGASATRHQATSVT